MLTAALALFSLGLLTLAVGFVVRSRIRNRTQGRELTDDDVARILHTGTLEREEPLDLDQVNQAEERFWSETWDEAEEY